MSPWSRRKTGADKPAAGVFCLLKLDDHRSLDDAKIITFVSPYAKDIGE